MAKLRDNFLPAVVCEDEWHYTLVASGCQGAIWLSEFLCFAACRPTLLGYWHSQPALGIIPL